MTEPIDNSQVTATTLNNTKTRNTSFPLVLLLCALSIAVGWLWYDLDQLKKQVWSMGSELSYVGDLARNADQYAHSHYSDQRLKKNIEDMGTVLPDLLGLRTVTFHWNTDDFSTMGFSDQKQIGLIAQEVEAVYPELVSSDKNGYKTVKYDLLTPILIQAIREQQTSIEELENQNETLLDRLSAIEAAIAQ